MEILLQRTNYVFPKRRKTKYSAACALYKWRKWGGWWAVGGVEMDCLMIGKCFTDQGLDTQIYASYAAHQLWGRCKRKLCFCDRFSNTTDKMILNERNWIVLFLYFIYLCTTDSYLQCVLEGDQNWMILWYWVCYSNCERNKPAMRRTGATNRVKPQEVIAEKKLLEA